MPLFRSAAHRRETFDRIARDLGEEIAGRALLLLDFLVGVELEDLDNYILRVAFTQLLNTTGAIAAEIALDIYTFYLIFSGQI